MMILPSQTHNHPKVYLWEHICEVFIISRLPNKVTMLHISDRGPDSPKTPGHECPTKQPKSCHKYSDVTQLISFELCYQQNNSNILLILGGDGVGVHVSAWVKSIMVGTLYIDRMHTSIFATYDQVWYVTWVSYRPLLAVKYWSISQTIFEAHSHDTLQYIPYRLGICNPADCPVSLESCEH